jgi:hypothetical protein
MTAPLPTASRWNTFSRSRYPRLWDGCVGAWCPSLGHTGSRLFDYSGRQAWGTLTNTASDTIWTTNGGGLALNMDGVDDYVGGFGTDLAFASGNDRNISMSCWFRTTDTEYALISRAANASGSCRYSLASNASSEFYLFVAGTTPEGFLVLQSGVTVNDGVWHHVGATIAGSGACEIYVDGVRKNTGIAPVTTVQNYLFLLGKYNDASGLDSGNIINFSGQMDDIRMYTRILHPEEFRILGRRRAIAYEPATRPAYYTETDAGGGGITSRPYAWQSARLIGAGR